MAKIADEDKLRILSATGMERLRELLEEDEDFRFPTIRLNKSKSPKYELPEPTADDRDNIESEATFKAVVLVSKKNFYLSDEDKEEGKEAKEKRVLYILRPGKKVPERIFISPSSLRNWGNFCKEAVDGGGGYFEFMCEFSGEHCAPAKSKYKWNKFKFAIDRRLTDEEMAHVEEVRALVSTRIAQYENAVDVDKYEDLASGNPRRDDDDAVDRHSAKRRKDIEDEEDEDPKAKKPAAKKAPAKKKPADDDDEDEAPKPKKKPVADDDDDEDEKPKPKKKPAADDEDDEDEKPKPKKKPADDDDDEDEKPKPKKKPADDDDDEDEKPKSKKKAGYPDLEDDDDEDLGATKKKAKPVADDDDDEDEKPKAKKKPSLDDDDED